MSLKMTLRTDERGSHRDAQARPSGERVRVSPAAKGWSSMRINLHIERLILEGLTVTSSWRVCLRVMGCRVSFEEEAPCRA
jgi:hypothetical protein